MKNILIASLVLFSAAAAFAQEVTGNWYGVLEVPNQKLRVVLHISENDGVYTTTMDSPDQHASGLPVKTTTFVNSVLTLEVPQAQVKYVGTLKNGVIEGMFHQGPGGFKLDFSREEKLANRPQTPKGPFPYSSEDVSFTNQKEGIKLAGTLTLPNKTGNFPVVVLISGSGQQNRDEEIAQHKPFLVLADHLTRNGIAVLRYDDRGTGESEGDPRLSTTADFANDAAAAVDYLKTRKEINPKKIGLLGHSEGGMIAPMLASSRSDIAFIVLMAGPGLRGDDLLVLQNDLIGKASGLNEAQLAENRKTNHTIYNFIIDASDNSVLQQQLTAELLRPLVQNPAMIPDGATAKEFVQTQVAMMMQPWMQYFVKYDPTPALKKTKCPVLAINGTNDLQVSAKENLAAIESSLKSGGNKKVTVKEFPGLNHLFQTCKTCLPTEYGEIEQTISPEVLAEISSWISHQ